MIRHHLGIFGQNVEHIFQHKLAINDDPQDEQFAYSQLDHGGFGIPNIYQYSLLSSNPCLATLVMPLAQDPPEDQAWILSALDVKFAEQESRAFLKQPLLVFQ